MSTSSIILRAITTMPSTAITRRVSCQSFLYSAFVCTWDSSKWEKRTSRNEIKNRPELVLIPVAAHAPKYQRKKGADSGIQRSEILPCDYKTLWSDISERLPVFTTGPLKRNVSHEACCRQERQDTKDGTESLKCRGGW